MLILVETAGFIRIPDLVAFPGCVHRRNPGIPRGHTIRLRRSARLRSAGLQDCQQGRGHLLGHLENGNLDDIIFVAIGDAKEVAALALFLCSDDAGFITGADYPIDGGFFNLHS